MKYAYIRVSTKDQNEARQIASMLEQGVDPDNMFIDKQSGKDFERTSYEKMIMNLKEGDVVFIHSIDRLGRNYDQIIRQWQLITKQIKADVVVLDMPLLDTRQTPDDLTGRFMADIVLQILSYVAEKERENTRQRQAEGIKIALKAGKFKKKDIDMELFRKLRDDVNTGLLSVKTAAEELGVSRTTWYKLNK